MANRERLYSPLKVIVSLEMVLFLLAGLFVTNMHPQWMQNSICVLGGFLAVTIVAWGIMLKDRHHDVKPTDGI